MEHSVPVQVEWVMSDKSDPSREVTLEELDSTYLMYVENQLNHLLGCITSPQHSHRVEVMVLNMINTRDKIEELRKKAVAGKLTLGEAIQHFKVEKKKRKPRRRKVLTRYERVIKNFL